MADFDRHEQIAPRLGQYKAGKFCLHTNERCGIVMQAKYPAHAARERYMLRTARQ